MIWRGFCFVSLRAQQESGFLWRIAEDPRSLGVSQDLDSENDWEVPLERGVDMSASPSPAASQPVAPRRPSSVLAEERDPGFKRTCLNHVPM